MLLVLSALLAGCSSSPDPDLPLPMFAIDSAEPYAQPWPGDQHLDPDGTLSFAAFQRPAGINLVESYVALGEQQVGWGTTTPIFVRLDREPDPTLLPSPAESLEDGSSLVLLDIDPDSPHRGERVPVVWRLGDVVSTYQPEGLFAVAPAPGFPLRGGTRYALLLMDSGFAVNPAFQDVFRNSHPHHDLWEEVPGVLREAGLRKRDVATGVVFTTTDPTAEMGRIADHLHEVLPPPELDQQLVRIDQLNGLTVYEGTYLSPVYTHGERPYLLEGGGFRFTADGLPEVASWDPLRLAVCVPEGSPPPTGWPVVVYQHGTGGDYRTPCDSNSSLEPGRVVGEAGCVTLSIDQPLHGTRNGGEPFNQIASFNILNPVSGRTNFRQGAADALYLARGLHAGPVSFTLPDGTPLPLDPDSVTFLGHSQGGLTGALAAPFWDGDVRATVLSGAGGMLSFTVVDRDDIVDFAALVAGVARFRDEEAVHELHPLLAVVQTLVEPTDPINYAPHWFRSSLDRPDGSPTPVLAFSGTEDEATPVRTANALAGAAGLPPLPPRVSELTALDLRDVPDATLPAVDNAAAWDGRTVTAGFSQWDGGSHFVIFVEPAAADLYQGFLSTAVDGAPVLDPTPRNAP